MGLIKIIVSYLFFLGICLLHTSVYSQVTLSPEAVLVSDELNDHLIEVWNHLHANPELSGEEKVSSAYIQKYLLDLGMEVKVNIGGYGVVGVLNGSKKGRSIAWRADIDAIPDHSYSENHSSMINEKAIHNCGHDVHITIGLGIAKVLSNQKDKLKGTVYFIFQPSEENYEGAKAMLADGLLDIIKPDEIYAAHVAPMPTGLIATKPNYLFADYKQVNLTFEKSNDDKDLINNVKEYISSLQNVAPDSPFWQMQNLLDPEIGIGNPQTIYNDYVTVEDDFKIESVENKIVISAYLSASDNNLMSKIPDQLEEMIKASKYADQLHRIEYGSDKFAYSNQRGNVNNDIALYNEAIKLLSSMSNKSITTIPLYGVMPDGRGDDFAYFQQKVPGVYFFIGGSKFEKGIVSMPHSHNFSVDTNIIKVGVEAFSSLIKQRVNID